MKNSRASRWVWWILSAASAFARQTVRVATLIKAICLFMGSQVESSEQRQFKEAFVKMLQLVGNLVKTNNFGFQLCFEFCFLAGHVDTAFASLRWRFCAGTSWTCCSWTEPVGAVSVERNGPPV
jgi:hypothetical protein